MSRKVTQVPVQLDPRDVKELSEEEIRTILRGADELIMSGGRGLLAKVLKGSRQKAVLEHELDRLLATGDASQDLDWPTEKNPNVLTRVLEKIVEKGDSKYRAVLKRWQKKASRRTGSHIQEIIRAMEK